MMEEFSPLSTPDAAEELLAATEGLFPGSPASETPEYYVSAGAFLARCRRLFKAMLVLWRAQEFDALGVLYRTLLECWMSGVYLLLGEEEALEELRAADLHHKDRIEIALGMRAPDDRTEGARRLPVVELARRVDGLIDQAQPDAVGWSVRQAYDLHFRNFSRSDAHGGLASLWGYIEQREGGRLLIHAGRSGDEPAKLAEYLLGMGVGLVMGFSDQFAQRAGIHIEVLPKIMERWDIDDD